jgi:hypothetical protein
VTFLVSYRDKLVVLRVFFGGDRPRYALPLSFHLAVAAQLVADPVFI